MTEKLFTDLEYNYKYIEERVSEAALKAGKTRNEIMLLGATKTVEPKAINHAISLGLKYIGENRVQELLQKHDDYDKKNAELQFIGHLQTNKVNKIVDKVSLIQSVDSIKLAKEIARVSENLGKITEILVEVNIGNEETKSGVAPENLQELLVQMALLSDIKVKGLMCIPPIYSDKSKIFKNFNTMHKLFIDISSKKLDNITMNILSMGMSDDYYEAILSGANMIRIGSALFGARYY